MRMRHDPIASGKRKAVNLSLDTGVVAAAREAGVNLSQACEVALRDAARAAAAFQWEERNRSAIEGWNRWMEKNGSPLDKYRAF